MDLGTSPDGCDRTGSRHQIIECASKGQQSHEFLLDAGRRAVIDQFGTVDALRSAFCLHERGRKMITESFDRRTGRAP